MRGDGRKIGDITIFLQLYNQRKSEFFASTVSSHGGKQRHARVYGQSPHERWGQRGRGTLKCRRPAQYMWYCRVNTESDGLWEVGMCVLTQVSLTQLRQWRPLIQAWGWGNSLGSQTGREGVRVTVTHHLFKIVVRVKKRRGRKEYLLLEKCSWFWGTIVIGH